MKALRYILVSLSLAGYVFLAVFGLVAMGYVHQHTMTSMDHCPFMIGEHSLCNMNFVDHINVWENLTNTIITTVFLVPIIITYFFLFLRPPNLARIRLYKKPYREKFITSLFSQGILNPKAP
jgi:hypothetical protein